MSTMVEVFNRLTQQELGDPSKFEHILSENYQKFVYFYWTLTPDLIGQVASISCEIHEPKELDILVSFASQNELDCFNNTFSPENASYSLKEHFEMFVNKGDGLCLHIRLMNAGIDKEDDLYASVVNTNKESNNSK